MIKLIKIKNIFLNKKIKGRNKYLGTIPFDKETDYKIEKHSSIADTLRENECLSNENIREAIHNISDINNEIELEQMSKTDFYQLSYMDCLPNVVDSATRKRTKKLIKDRKN